MNQNTTLAPHHHFFLHQPDLYWLYWLGSNILRSYNVPVFLSREKSGAYSGFLGYVSILKLIVIKYNRFVSMHFYLMTFQKSVFTCQGTADENQLVFSK